MRTIEMETSEGRFNLKDVKKKEQCTVHIAISSFITIFLL